MRRAEAWVCAVMLAAGSVTAMAIEERAAYAAEGAAIGVLDSGDWYEYTCESTCWRKHSFWIDLDVRDDAYDKQVAVVWTDDGWETHQVSYAQYEGELGGGRERWGVDVMAGYFSGPYDRLQVEYAAFVVMGGVTHWDPFSNHHIYGRVTRERPVQLLDSQVRYEAGTGAVLSGHVRVYNLAFAKQVTVVYSTDDWATASTTEASWARDNEWSFRVEGLGVDALPETVRFALRYRVAGEEHWDNNFGYDYAHRLEPQISLSPPWSTPEEPLGGIFTVYGSQWGDLPLERIDVRLDDGPWQLGDVDQAWRQVELSTFGLADGEHTLEGRAVLKGGYQTTSSQTVYVQNRFTPLGAWDPDFGALEGPPAESHGTSHGLAVAAGGQVFLQWDEPWRPDSQPSRGIVRFAAFGTNLAPMAYERLPDVYSSVERLAVDDGGGIYGLQPWPAALWRWTASGAIDTGFGDEGRLDFTRDFDGYYLDAVGDVTTGGGALWVVGRCPGFVEGCGHLIARLDDTGAVTGVLALPEHAPDQPYWYDYTVPVATWADGVLWVASQGELLQVGDDGQGGLAVLSSVALAATVRAPLQDLVRTPDGALFGLDSSARLVAIADDGTLAASWMLTSYQRLPGGVRWAVQLAVLADGNLGVLDGDSGLVVAFDDEVATVD